MVSHNTIVRGLIRLILRRIGHIFVKFGSLAYSGAAQVEFLKIRELLGRSFNS